MSKLDHFMLWFLFGSWCAQWIIPFLPFSREKLQSEFNENQLNFNNNQLEFNDAVLKNLHDRII